MTMTKTLKWIFCGCMLALLSATPRIARADSCGWNPPGCNGYGCWQAGGGCNGYGCWSNGEGCNGYGCWSSPAGSCNGYGCDNNGACNGDLIALRVNPSTATTPISLGIAWCASGNDIQSPLVSTSDGTHDAIVWSVSGTDLNAFDGDRGAPLASINAGSMQYWNTPIIAKGRMFLTTANTNKTIAILP